MHLHRKAAALVVVAAAVSAGCETTGIEGTVIADLAGTWDANQLTFAPASDTSSANPVPFVSLGGDLVVTLTAAGTFSGTLTVPAALTPTQQPMDLAVAGTMSISDADDEELLVVDFNAATETAFQQAGLPFEDFDGPFTLSGNQLTITNDTDFDFDTAAGPRTAEAAVMTMVLVRTST